MSNAALERRRFVASVQPQPELALAESPAAGNAAVLPPLAGPAPAEFAAGLPLEPTGSLPPT
jgi:hypothetical protein